MSFERRHKGRMTSSDAQAQAMATQGHVSFSPPVHSASSGALFLAAVAFLCLAMGSCALGLSLVVCPAGIMSSDYRLANMVCNESWFKYLIPLLVPVTAWFGIANWRIVAFVETVAGFRLGDSDEQSSLRAALFTLGRPTR